MRPTITTWLNTMAATAAAAAGSRRSRAMGRRSAHGGRPCRSGRPLRVSAARDGAPQPPPRRPPEAGAPRRRRRRQGRPCRPAWRGAPPGVTSKGPPMAPTVPPSTTVETARPRLSGAFTSAATKRLKVTAACATPTSIMPPTNRGKEPAVIPQMQRAAPAAPKSRPSARDGRLPIRSMSMPQRKAAPEPARVEAAAGTPARLLWPLSAVPAMAETVDVAMKAAEARHWAANRTAVILLAAAECSSIPGMYSGASFAARGSFRLPLGRVADQPLVPGEK